MEQRFRFVLDPVEADVLAQAHGVRIGMFPLRIPKSTTDPVRLAALAGKVEQSLGGRRLSVGGRLSPQVREAFDVLTDNRVTVAVSGIDADGDTIAAVGLTDGSRALSIAQPAGGRELRFELFPDDELVAEMAGFVPSMPPAEGAPLTVAEPLDESLSAMSRLRRAEQAHDKKETEAFGNLGLMSQAAPSAGRSRSRSDSERLADALSGERLGSGRVQVSGRSGRQAQPFGWVDTEGGRYLVRGGPEGKEYVARYFPATHADVAETVGSAVADVY